MKPLLLLIAGLLLYAPVARAQVIINQAALDQLAGIAPPAISAPPGVRQAPRQMPRRVTYRRPVPRALFRARRLAGIPVVVRPVVANPVATKPAVLPQPSVNLPAQKPAVQPVLARPVIAPPVVPKPQPPVAIAFAAGAADLPGNGAAMLKPFCAHPGGVVIIDAYAAADPADPSAAARLSMSRAFAIRDALTACGIPSSNIIPPASGSARTANPDAAKVSASP